MVPRCRAHIKGQRCSPLTSPATYVAASRPWAVSGIDRGSWPELLAKLALRGARAFGGGAQQDGAVIIGCHSPAEGEPTPVFQCPGRSLALEVF